MDLLELSENQQVSRMDVIEERCTTVITNLYTYAQMLTAQNREVEAKLVEGFRDDIVRVRSAIFKESHKDKP